MSTGSPGSAKVTNLGWPSKGQEQCQRSYVVIFWPVLCINFPFQLREQVELLKTRFSVNNPSDVISQVEYHRSVMSYLRDMDLTRSVFWPICAQGLSQKFCKVSAWSAQRFGSYFRKKKTPGRVRRPHPSLCGREVNFQCRSVGNIKKVLFKYCWSDQPKTLRIMLP